VSGSSGRVVLRTGVATDTGRVRSVNEDSYMLLPDQGLWVVADGMGGAQAGDVASQMAIETLRSCYLEPTIDALVDAMAEANRRIHEAAGQASELKGMGTTTVAIALVPEEPDPDHPEIAPDDVQQVLLVINVGDSRAYLFRDGSLTQLTEDHSVVAELVRDGRISQEEADAHPQRNIITRVLGVYPQVKADIWPVDPIRGDRYLLCSDGLFNEVGDDQMASVLRRLEDPNEAADELVRLAVEGGGRDNVTVIVLDVVDDGGQAQRASRALSGDLAGFSSAVDRRDRLSDDELDGVRSRTKGSRSERRAERKAAKTGRTRVTWRVLLFTVLLLAVVGGAFATIQWYGTSTYYVGFDGDEVTIFQGRPGGLLWIDPKLEDGTGILRDEVPERYLDALEAGHQQSSLAQARRYVSNIERDIADTAPTTTSTVPTGTTTAATPSAPN
jgi:serine/threonine protein phosphatase PrpC